MTRPVRHLERSARAVLAATLACTTAACTSGPTALASSGQVRVATRASRVVITNETQVPVFTFTVGARTAALILWAPCVDAARCPPIAPHATAEESYPAAFQRAAEEEAIVHWWHAVRGSDGALRPDSVRAIRVRL